MSGRLVVLVEMRDGQMVDQRSIVSALNQMKTMVVVPERHLLGENHFFEETGRAVVWAVCPVLLDEHTVLEYLAVRAVFVPSWLTGKVG